MVSSLTWYKIKPVEPEPKSTRPVGFWNFAMYFFRAAETLVKTKNAHHDGVAYYLFSHSVELALKALFAFKGYDDDKLRAFLGHDLKRAWKKAIRAGFDDYLTEAEFDRIQKMVLAINPYYKTKELEYLRPGIKRYPWLSEMYVCTAHLLLAAGHAIEIPIPHLSRFHEEIILQIDNQ